MENVKYILNGKRGVCVKITTSEINSRMFEKALPTQP